MLMGIDDIRARLPHRDPILLPQEVHIEDKGRAGYAWFSLDAKVRLMGEESQRDLSRELMLESAAQAFGVVLGSVASGVSPEDERHLLLGFNNVRFTMLGADLGASFKVGVRMLESSGSTHVAAFRVTQAELCVAEGALMVMKG